jgi:hypothetical protein
MLASVHNKLTYSDIIRLLKKPVFDENTKMPMEYLLTKNVGCSKILKK